MRLSLILLSAALTMTACIVQAGEDYANNLVVNVTGFTYDNPTYNNVLTIWGTITNTNTVSVKFNISDMGITVTGYNQNQLPISESTEGFAGLDDVNGDPTTFIHPGQTVKFHAALIDGQKQIKFTKVTFFDVQEAD